MADMYNKDYADDILRKLKQKIISENPEAVDALDTFAESTAGDGDREDEEEVEEISLFDVESGEEDESFQDEDDEDEEDESHSPIDVVDGEEDAFGYTDDEPEETEDEYWEAEEDQEDDDDDDVAPWDVIEPQDEEEDEPASDEDDGIEDGEEAEDLAEDVEEKGEEYEPNSPEEEEIPPEKDEKTEDTSEIVDVSPEEDIPDKEEVEAETEEDILPAFVSKRKRKITEDPEESVVVQKTEEQTDVLKRPLPRGQKATSSFFLHRKNKNAEEGDEHSNSAITAWRTVTSHTKLTFAALIIMALLTVFLAVLECVPPVRSLIFNFEDENKIHTATMLLDSGCLLLCLLTFLPAIIQGVKRLGDHILDAELSTAAVAVLAMLYQLCFGIWGDGLFLIGFPFAFLLTLSQLSRLFMALAVKNSAEICLNSHNGTTAVLRRASDLPEVKEALADSEIDHHVVMSTAKFTDTNAFLARLEKEHISSRYNCIGLCGAVLAGVVSAVFAGIYQSPNAIGHGLAVLCAAFPLSFYLIHHWSFYRLAKELKSANMTVAGEFAVYELANADVVCLRDVDAFPTSHVKLTHIKLCEDKRLDLIFMRLRALFSVLGGPLNGLFSVSGDDADRPMDVSILDITPDGISAVVDGETVLVGKGAYMAQKGIPFMYDADDETLIRTTDSPIMFVAIGGVSSAKLYLHYKINEAFESYVHHLTNTGIGVVIRTSDPFITVSMIDRLSCLEKGSVGVVRSTVGGKNATDSLSGGLVGYGTKPQTIYQTRFLFSAYRRMQQSLPWLSLASIPLCGVLCALSAAAGAVSLSLMTVLYQLLGAIPALCIIEAVLRKYHMGDKQ